VISRHEAEQWAEEHLPGGRWVKPGVEYLVRSPLRADKNPSFGVNFEKRCYTDRGAGEEGKLSELCRLLGAPEPGREGRNSPSPAAGPDFNAVVRNGEAKRDGQYTAKDSAVLAAARELWEQASPADGHAYVTRKQIDASGLRRSERGLYWKDGELHPLRGSDFILVPAFDDGGNIVAVEQITRTGAKFHLGREGDKGRAFFLAGDMDADGPLLVCEGAATAASAHLLSGWTAASCFGAPQLVAAARLFRKRFPGRDIVVAPDHDDAGRGAAAEARRAGFKVVELPQGSKNKDDWNDLLCERGVEQAREMFQDCWQAALAAGAINADEHRATRFKLQRIGDIELVEPKYLVNGLVESDTLAMFFGETESFKSFCAIDLAACIATGAPWAGRQVKEGAVVYVAGEGRGGLARRARAWELQRGISLADAPLFVSSKPGLLLDEQSALEVEAEVDRVAAEYGAPLLIVIDTVARAMSGGDENASKDMGLFVERVDALRRRYGATVLLVHHSGLVDKGRGRGSSALKAALDAEYQVERVENTAIVAATKTKDGPRPAPLYFEAVEHVVMVTSGGDEITSLAMARTDDKPAAREERLTASQRAAMETYRAAAKDNPALDDEGRFLGVHLNDWQPVFFAVSTASTYGGKWRAFDRARKELVAKGKLSVENDVYAAVEPADALLLNDYARRLKNLPGVEPAKGSNRQTSTNIDNVDTCRYANTAGISTDIDTPLKGCRSVDAGLSIETKEGGGNTVSSDGEGKKENPSTALSEERAVRVPSPRGQKILGAKDVSFRDALRWARVQPGLMKRLSLEARQMGDGGMMDAWDYLNTAVKCEYAAWLNSEAAASTDQGDSSEAVPSKSAPSASQGANMEPGATDQEAGVHLPLAGEASGMSIEAIAARAGVDIEAAREGVSPWVKVGRLAVSGDSVRIVEGAELRYPGDDETDDEPPDDAPDTREGEEPNAAPAAAQEPDEAAMRAWLDAQGEDIRSEYQERLDRLRRAGLDADGNTALATTYRSRHPILPDRLKPVLSERD